jgi:hypothetical protein
VVLALATLSAASATIQGMESWLKKPLSVTPLQEYHSQLTCPPAARRPRRDPPRSLSPRRRRGAWPCSSPRYFRCLR